MLATVLSRLLSGLKGRILADAAARLWGAVLSFALVPLYLRFIGVEAYGLVGLFVSIQTMLALLDFGLGASLTRELARTSGADGDWARARDLTRTLEVVYWGLAAVAALGFFLLAPVIADRWLNPEKLTADEVRSSLRVGAAAIAVQWAGTLYVGGLLGLQKQQTLALIGIISATVRAGATVAVLWAISPTVQAMFWVQAAVGLVNTLVLVWLLWASIPGPRTRPVFRAGLFSDIWKFATGLSGIAVTSLILMQADKIILSRLLPLGQFGYYVLASTLAGGIYVLVAPIFGAIFPRLTELVATKSEAEVSTFYHLSGQIVSAAILPVAAILAMFPSDALMLWTGNALIAEQAKWIVVLLVIGNAINGLMNPPFALQLAHGWTSFAFYASVVSTVLLVPLLLVLTLSWGAVGAAATWALLNVGGLLISPYILHRYLLRTELVRWYTRDILLPILVSFSAAVACRLVTHEAATRTDAAMQIVPAFLVVALLTSLCSAPIRVWLTANLLGRGARRA
ncbi:MAG: oligosaccharide flippase family protein [Hyphomicrobiaceae bacterium]|nr:MAG: oligosaccharide flippase family protein [Hyphomicrobiaceae bacterium]